MKKIISLVCAAAAVLNLCGCTDGGKTAAGGIIDEINGAFDQAAGELSSALSEEVPKTESGTAESADTEANENADTTSAPDAAETDTPAPDGEISPSGENPADEYVRIDTIETKYGYINYPVLNTEKLDADEAAAANALFEHIRDKVLADGAEANEIIDQWEVRPPVAKVYASVYGNILSVLMSYEYTFGYHGTHYKSVIFDISTGRAISSDEAAKAVSLTTEDIKASILWFSKIYMLNLRDMNYIYGIANMGALPEFLSHDGFANDEKVILETTLNDYDNCVEYSDVENEGMPWESLPLQHTAYIDERGQLYVLGAVASDWDIVGIPIAVAHDEEEIASANYRGEFAPIVRKHYFEPIYAAQAITDIVDPAIMPTFDTEGVITVYDDYWDRYFPAYSVNVFSNTGYAPALVEKYAVGVFESFIWKMDDNGEWEKLNAPFGFNEDEARGGGAIAAVWRPAESPQPFSYLLWAAKPIYEVTLGSTDRITPADQIMNNCSTALVYALYDETNVALLEGDTCDKRFTLNAGEFAAVYFVAGDEAVEAIEVSTGFSKGIFALTNGIYEQDSQPLLICADNE